MDVVLVLRPSKMNSERKMDKFVKCAAKELKNMGVKIWS